MVTVQDTMPPQAIYMDITVELDALSNAYICPNIGDNGSVDNCAISSMTISQKTFTTDHMGDNTVTLNIPDTSSNTSTCTTTVTVID